MNANGTVKSSQKIASGTGGGPTLANGDRFGSSMASLGDLDGDGVTDLAVGPRAMTRRRYRGAVHVLFLNANGTVKEQPEDRQRHRVAARRSPTSTSSALALASLGDLDGDGVTRAWPSGRSATTRAERSRGRARAVPERQRHGEEQPEDRQRRQRRAGLGDGDYFGRVRGVRSATWMATA